MMWINIPAYLSKYLKEVNCVGGGIQLLKTADAVQEFK